MRKEIGEEKYQKWSKLNSQNKWSLYDMDKNVISSLCGFENSDDYYDFYETKGKLHHVKVPSLYF
jgi:predicted alpha/beta-fold hydrolase